MCVWRGLRSDFAKLLCVGALPPGRHAWGEAGPVPSRPSPDGGGRWVGVCVGSPSRGSREAAAMAGGWARSCPRRRPRSGLGVPAARRGGRSWLLEGGQLLVTSPNKRSVRSNGKVTFAVSSKWASSRGGGRVTALSSVCESKGKRPARRPHSGPSRYDRL